LMIAKVRRRATSFSREIGVAARVVAVRVSVSSDIVGDAANQRTSDDNRTFQRPQSPDNPTAESFFNPPSRGITLSRGEIPRRQVADENAIAVGAAMA